MYFRRGRILLARKCVSVVRRAQSRFPNRPKNVINDFSRLIQSKRAKDPSKPGGRRIFECEYALRARQPCVATACSATISRLPENTPSELFSRVRVPLEIFASAALGSVMGSSFSPVIVVTGASGGIGRATARAFARPGVCIALLARGERGLDGARREVEQAGAESLVLPTDVADEAQVEAAAAAVEARWGRIDIWVNNAMATIFGAVSSLSGEQIKRATEVTYLGAVYGTLAALRRMSARDRGVIVQVGSALAYRAIPLQAPYCAAKHALRGFTDSLRCELLHDRSNVHLTMVHLSAFNTPQFDWALNLVGKRPMPVAPIFQPELAADAIVWAAGHRRREVYVGWPAVQAIVGNKLAPGLADRILAKRGYEGQITDEPVPADACSNLYRPCDTDPGAHGRFDRQARARSLHWQLTKHRRLIAGCIMAAVGIGVAALALRSEQPTRLSPRATSGTSVQLRR